MTKLRLINRASGLSKASGKPWARITLGCDRNDGNRTVADFFVSPELASKIASLPLDAFIYVNADLDQNLHFAITDLRPVDTPAK